MEYQEYQNRIEHGTQMFENGNFQAALEIFQKLVNSDISDIDKSRMSINVAVIYEKMGVVQQAFEWYKKAIEFEKPHYRFEAQEYLAVFMREQGRPKDSYRIYDSLSRSSHLTEEEKLRMRQKLEELEKEISNPQQARPGELE